MNRIYHLFLIFGVQKRQVHDILLKLQEKDKSMSTCSQVWCTCKLVTHISVTRLHFDCSWKFRLIVGKKLHQYSTCTCFNWN